MLTCQELTELITDYLEGHLSFLKNLRFQLHVGMCRHCRAYLRQMRATIAALEAMNAAIVPPAMPAELLRRFQDWRR